MKLMIPLFVSLGSLAAMAAPPIPFPEPTPPAGLEILHDVETGTGGARTLHVEIIRPTTPSPSPMAAILFVHGGGWGGGTHKDGGWIRRCLYFAQNGYVVVSVEYRLDKEAKWPAQIQDCKLAVRWLRANAAKYNVDPNRIGAWGVSAGGHLVACLGTMTDDPSLEGDGGYPGVSSKVQAVANVSGPTDFSDSTFGSGSDVITDSQKKQDTGMLIQLLGVLPNQHPEVWKGASPITHIHADDPPFLLLYGDKDAIVSLNQGQVFADALKKAGVPVDFEIIKGAGHVLMQVKGGPPPEKSLQQTDAMILAFFDKTLKAP